MNLNSLHEEAMDFAEKALREKQRGNLQDANSLFASALAKEKEVLALLEKEPYSEPMYSILYRSAATLALDCGEFRLAEKLASTALAKEPYEYVAEELRDVMEQANGFKTPQHMILADGVTTAEAAKIPTADGQKLSITSIRRLARLGEIRSFQIGGVLLVHLADLRAYRHKKRGRKIRDEGVPSEVVAQREKWRVATEKARARAKGQNQT